MADLKTGRDGSVAGAAERSGAAGDGSSRPVRRAPTVMLIQWEESAGNPGYLRPLQSSPAQLTLHDRAGPCPRPGTRADTRPACAIPSATATPPRCGCHADDDKTLPQSGSAPAGNIVPRPG